MPEAPLDIGRLNQSEGRRIFMDDIIDFVLRAAFTAVWVLLFMDLVFGVRLL